MESKTKFFFKWTFVFGVLSIWSVFVIVGAVGGNFIGEFNIPIYKQTSAGIERMSSDEIIEFLFKHDFDIEERNEFIPLESCSLRAEGGMIEINQNNLTKNKISFFIPLANDGLGEGSIISSGGENRLSLDFKVTEILNTDNESLVFDAVGEGRLNRENVDFDNIHVEYNRANNYVLITGMGDENFFSSIPLEVYFKEGCSLNQESFYLFIDNGELDEKRSIDEVRETLDEHPELIDSFEGLRSLYNDYWWITLPPSIGIS